MEKIPRTSADEYFQRLKPLEKAFYVRDSQVKGLFVRVKLNGSKSWIFCYTVPCHKKSGMNEKKGSAVSGFLGLEKQKCNYGGYRYFFNYTSCSFRITDLLTSMRLAGN